MICTCDLCDKDVSIVVKGHFATKGYCEECHAEMSTEALKAGMSFLDYWGF